MIRRLELHNFATHEDTEIEFGNSKNVIIGQTGSGKTNLLQAIDFAFLGGEQGVNLEELIADGADSTEIILDYLDPRSSQNYRIRRTLTRKAAGGVEHVSSITNLETNETIKKPDPVRKTLEALGVETSVFRYIVHVPQGKFADVLQEGQDRKTVLDRLFKIAQLDETYHELGFQEGPIRKVQDRRQTNLLKKVTLDQNASKLAQEETLYNKLTKERQTKQQKLEELKGAYEQLRKIASPVEEKLDRIDSLDAKINEARAVVKSSKAFIERLLSHLQEFLPNDEMVVVETLDSQRTREHLKKLELELLNLNTEREALDAKHTDSIKRAASAKFQHDAGLEEKSAIEKQLAEIRAYLNGKGAQPAILCDKCGSLLTSQQWIKHIDETKKKLEDITKKIEQTRRIWSDETLICEELQKKLNLARTRVENHSRITDFTGQLATQREEVERSEISPRQLTQERNGLLAELRLLMGNEPDDQIIQKARSVPTSLDSLREQMTESERELASYDDDILAPQTKRVDEAREAERRVNELRPQIELDTKKIEMLQLVRAAFKEIQPAVRKVFVSRITQSANDYLRRLYGGAEIENFELTDNYEFIVTRAGHKRHASRLSGGQQVLASMAFLLALSEVLSQLDFLILDEPTTHLDENRRKELVTVLENLRRVPQLIIVDHHPELLEAADTRFHVSLNYNGLSQLSTIEV
jgi:exonuclease SbcC